MRRGAGSSKVAQTVWRVRSNLDGKWYGARRRGEIPRWHAQIYFHGGMRA